MVPKGIRAPKFPMLDMLKPLDKASVGYFIVDLPVTTPAACAAPRRQDGGTWITDSMRDAYQRLHEQGFAHSVEVWQDGELAGGVYGVSLGGFFAGESMFHLKRDASKIALMHLVATMSDSAMSLLDVQWLTPHLETLGATEIPRNEYLRRLDEAVNP